MVDCAIILAAGENRRLGLQAEPKSLLPLGDGTFLSRHVELLSAAGVASILVVVNERSAAAFEPRLDSGMEIVVSPFPVGTVGSALSLLCGLEASLRIDSGRSLLVMDADIVYERMLLSMVLDDSTASQLFTVARTAGDVEEVCVYGLPSGEPLLVGKGLPSSVVGGLAAFGESLGIINLNPDESEYCRELIPWLTSTAHGAGKTGPMSEHEEVWQYLFTLRRLGVRQLPRELLFAECDTPDDYEYVSETVFPAIEKRDRERRRSLVG
jgi:choline kinase